MEKIKQFISQHTQSQKGKDILVVVIIILVGLGSFELGRLSKENANSGIKIEYPDQIDYLPGNAIESVNFTKTYTPSTDKTFFASNRGSKYYSLGCSGGRTIKPENRIYFETKEEAEKAGYELSSSCR